MEKIDPKLTGIVLGFGSEGEEKGTNRMQKMRSVHICHKNFPFSRCVGNVSIVLGEDFTSEDAEAFLLDLVTAYNEKYCKA